MDSKVDQAFNAGRYAWARGLGRWENPWQRLEPTPLGMMQAYAWTLGWLRAEHQAAMAERAVLRHALRAECARSYRR